MMLPLLRRRAAAAETAAAAAADLVFARNKLSVFLLERHPEDTRIRQIAAENMRKDF